VKHNTKLVPKETAKKWQKFRVGEKFREQKTTIFETETQ
jgi:hypothetical protein